MATPQFNRKEVVEKILDNTNLVKKMIIIFFLANATDEELYKYYKENEGKVDTKN